MLHLTGQHRLRGHSRVLQLQQTGMGLNGKKGQKTKSEHTQLAPILLPAQVARLHPSSSSSSSSSLHGIGQANLACCSPRQTHTLLSSHVLLTRLLASLRELPSLPCSAYHESGENESHTALALFDSILLTHVMLAISRASRALCLCPLGAFHFPRELGDLPLLGD